MAAAQGSLVWTWNRAVSTPVRTSVRRSRGRPPPTILGLESVELPTKRVLRSGSEGSSFTTRALRARVWRPHRAQTRDRLFAARGASVRASSIKLRRAEYPSSGRRPCRVTSPSLRPPAGSMSASIADTTLPRKAGTSGTCSTAHATSDEMVQPGGTCLNLLLG